MDDATAEITAIRESVTDVTDDLRATAQAGTVAFVLVSMVAVLALTIAVTAMMDGSRR